MFLAERLSAPRLPRFNTDLVGEVSYCRGHVRMKSKQLFEPRGQRPIANGHAGFSAISNTSDSSQRHEENVTIAYQSDRRAKGKS